MTEYHLFRNMRLFTRWVRVGLKIVSRSVLGGAGMEDTKENCAFAKFFCVPVTSDTL